MHTALAPEKPEKSSYTLINAWQRNRDTMKIREKENNIPLKNAVKRKSNSYNRQQMKSKIKKNKNKTKHVAHKQTQKSTQSKSIRNRINEVKK